METVRLLAKTGYTVIIACRNQEAGREAVATVRDRNTRDNSPSDVLTLPLDLNSLKSVKEFAERVKDHLKARKSSLTLLVNNAGVMFTPRQLTKDGYDMQFQVNYLSHKDGIKLTFYEMCLNCKFLIVL